MRSSLFILFFLLSVQVARAQNSREKILLEQWVQDKPARFEKGKSYIISYKKGKTNRLKEVRLVRQLTPSFAEVKIESQEAFDHLKESGIVLRETNHSFKLAPSLRPELANYSGQDKRSYFLRISQMKDFQQWMDKENIAYTIEAEFPDRNAIKIQAASNDFIEKILPSEYVLFAEKGHKQAIDEASMSYNDLGVNRINWVHHFYPQYKGQGLTLSLKERNFDENDLDLIGKRVETGLEDETSSSHATSMATFIAGAGNSFYKGKGAADQALLASVTYDNLMPESNDYFNAHQISVQNHSFGIAIENYYGIEAEAYDQSALENPTLLHVFSTGNIGTQTAEGGIYDGLEGYANMTGNMKMAKNVLTVGGTDTFRDVSERSSAGPAPDGRIKPEVVAYGPEGTSDAAAIASGITLLIQNAYRENHGTLPASSLLKSVLFASADDTGAKGIDHQTGYGSVNAAQAVEVIEKGWFEEGQVSQGAEQEWTITVPANTKQIRIAINWTDQAAVSGDQEVLINDLDSRLVYGSQSWKPWVLNNYPHPDSLALPAKRGEDHLHNTEFITLEKPDAGDYKIIVRGSTLSTTDQDYHLAYYIEEDEQFEWTFPTASDPIEASEFTGLRWKNTRSETTADLEVSFDGEPFQRLARVDLSEEVYYFKTPDSVAKTVFRMKIGSDYFSTDSVYINPGPRVQVGFNCDEEFNLVWNRVKNASSYQVFQMGETSLEMIADTQDSSVILQKGAHPSLFYAIKPVFEGSAESLRGLTYNYTMQGVGCYFRSFFAINNDSGLLQLIVQLGSTLNLKEVRYEKKVNNAYQVIHSHSIKDQLEYSFVDPDIENGLNYYRVSLVHENGEVYYSDELDVLYTNEENVLLFPNPVLAGEAIQIMMKGKDLKIQLFDRNGRMVKEKEIIEFDELYMDNLSRGLYIYRIYREGKAVFSGRIAVF